MRKSVFAAVLAVMTGLAGAQEVKLLEDIPAEPERAGAAQAGDEPQIIMPSEEKPAAEVKPAAEAAKPETQKKPAPAAKKKAVKKTAAAVKPAAAPIKAAAPAPAAVKPEEKAAPAAVKPEEKAASVAVKPAEKTAPAAVKPAEKTAASPVPAVKKTGPQIIPAAKPEVKPAVAVKPAASPVQPPPPGTETFVEPIRKPESPAGFVVPKTHTVAGGDTLWDLSNKYYSDPFKWGRIYNANLGVVSNPDLIHPKSELVIPDISEELRPEAKKPLAITGGDTVREASLTSEDVAQPAEEEPTYSAPRPAAPAAELKEALAAYDRNDLSEEMPEHQKEWASGVKIVPETWREDGVITARESGDDDAMEESLSMSGAMVRVSMSGAAAVKRGDYLSIYMKGADAFDGKGKKLGREVQRAGTLEVVEADGSDVRARVIDSVTGIYKGYVVKKK